MTNVNNAANTATQIGTATANTFVLPGKIGVSCTTANPQVCTFPFGTYTSGGTAYCTVVGCEFYRFANDDGGTNVYRVNTCATERTTNSYTDDPPSTTFLGRNYRSGGAACLTDEIVPLTSDKDVLHDVAENLVQGGSTAGHIGVAWSWYMVSPEFAYLWPEDNQPAPEDEDNIIRAVIIMTDGMFNTAYYNGVVAQDSGTGSGGANTHINHDAANGSSHDQGEDICQGIKDADEDYIIYTIAFALQDIDDDDDREDAEALMLGCASDPSKYFDAGSTAALYAAFEAIGADLASLRVTR